MSEILPLKQEKGSVQEEKSSFEAFKNALEVAARELLKVIENGENLGETPTLEEQEEFYFQIKEVQQNITFLLEERVLDEEGAIKTFLKQQEDLHINAKLITENMSILKPEVQEWLKILTFVKRGINKDDKIMLRELSSNLQRDLPSKVEKFLGKVSFFKSLVRKATNSELKEMYNVRKYAARFVEQHSKSSQ